MILLQATATFSLAGHQFAPGSIFECEDELAQHLVRRKLAERISHGAPLVTLMSPTISWSRPTEDELQPGGGNWMRDGRLR